MSRQYPMWFNVTNCNYSKGNTDFGGRDNIKMNVLVGSSSKNSNEFFESKTTRTFTKWKGKEVIVFKHSVDNVIVKIMIFENVKDRPGKLLKTLSKLKYIKSLILK